MESSGLERGRPRGGGSNIPTNWVQSRHVMWPNGINVLKAMKEFKSPEENWMQFDLVKIKFTSGLFM